MTSPALQHNPQALTDLTRVPLKPVGLLVHTGAGEGTAADLACTAVEAGVRGAGVQLTERPMIPGGAAAVVFIDTVHARPSVLTRDRGTLVNVRLTQQTSEPRRAYSV